MSPRLLHLLSEHCFLAEARDRRDARVAAARVRQRAPRAAARSSIPAGALALAAA